MVSALRFSRPGIVGTILVDLGPAVGRTTHTRGAIYGGVMVAAAPQSREERRRFLQAEAQRRRREARS